MLTREEIVELADAVAAQGIASGIGTTATARSSSSRPTRRTRRWSGAAEFVRAAAAGRAAAGRWPVTAVSEDEDDDVESTSDDPARVPRRLPVRGSSRPGRVDPAARPGRLRDRVQARAGGKPGPVRRHLCRPLRRPVHRAASRSAIRGRPAGSDGLGADEGARLHYEVPGGLRRTGSRSPRSSAAIYHPSCNEQQYEQAWKDEWIGEYSAPTTGPLTTGRDPD